VEAARKLGYDAQGPFPADTIFVRARDQKAFDGVVTMYHDQGQIAMKLMGFWRGVTVHGGLPVPIATPAHGTAFDIHGRGKADVGATQKAFDIVTRMAMDRVDR
jgi:4-hydroxythreonine-4-phosphate dehydrogenase